MQDTGVLAGLGRRRGERIADAVIARGHGAGAQLVGHRLETHQAPHAREQRGVVDGLGQEIVGAGIEPLHAVARLVERRHHDDRNMSGHGRVLEPPAHLEAVHAGHHHVEQDDVAQALLAERDARPARSWR